MAEFVSPRVCLSHFVDPSIAEYIVEAQDSKDEFHLFLSLGSGSTIAVTQANLNFFLSLSREFGNSNLYMSLLEYFESDFLCSQLHDSTTLDLFSEDLIGRISSKFYELIGSNLGGISVSVLFHILSHQLLMISSEDDLFSYISSRICTDPEYFDLLQFVRFEYLSAECFCCFLPALQDSIDRHLWESISRRLMPPVPPVSPSKSLTALEFPLTEAKSVDGIISYLTRRHGGNVYFKGIVNITSKSFEWHDDDHNLGNVADLTSDSYFLSEEEPRQWICWDFQDMRVRPTHYTIYSRTMRKWVVEGSLDGEAWIEIDRQTSIWDDGSFAVSKSPECRFIRLTQRSRNRHWSDLLTIRAFEVFGTLIE
jgi:hypothetical protein